MSRRPFRASVRPLLAMIALAAPATLAHAEPPAVAPQSPAAPSEFSIADAVKFALEHNPDLNTVRKQHGIAEAAVIVAHTYPFNPVATSYVWGDNGPVSAGVTNHVFNEQVVRLDLELFHQGRHRKAAAHAALSRVEWEIATQETALALRVIRACTAFSYRREKLRLVEEGARLQQQSAEQIGKLVEQGKLNRADLILARADLAELRTLRAPAYTLYTTAWYDLRRALGLVEEPLAGVRDPLASSAPTHPAEDEIVATALARRPELQALRIAIDEADARYRLEVANRWGNPSIGPAYEYNETSVTFVGLAATYPIPLLNTHRGEIQARRAERERAQAAFLAAEVGVHQDVKAALARLLNSSETVEAFRKESLPAAIEARKSIDQLLALGEPGAEVSRAVDARRRELRVRDLYLDALYELNQARADFAAAVGDPSLAFADVEAPK